MKSEDPTAMPRRDDRTSMRPAYPAGVAKSTRITLTKSQAESPSGKSLIDLILAYCHDGEITIDEVENLHLFLRKDESGFAAVAFLRAITREIVSDGAVDALEAYRLKKAFERVVPKEVRGIVSTHLEQIGVPPSDSWDEPPAWTRHEATAKQIDYIAALGGSVGTGLTKGEAATLIDELLQKRPPTPRQMMVLRFFDRLDLAGSTKEVISEWMDEYYATDEKRELAWARFKRETSHDLFGQDPSIVPVGAYKMYLKVPRGEKRAGSHRRVGCLPVIALGVLFAGVTRMLWHAS